VENFKQMKIYILLSYHDKFGSKATASPYRSGYDKKLLSERFEDQGFQVSYLHFSDIDFRKMNFKDQYVLYTATEDHYLHYKDYIEDVIYALQLQGARIIPEYKFLRAVNNKVFMEILRDVSSLEEIKNTKTSHFGALEDLNRGIESIDQISVIKPAGGAMSTGVSLSQNKSELLKNAKKLSRTKSLFFEFKDYLRTLKHKGYLKESKHRKKFIVQNFVPNLDNDWKVLVFGEKYYILYRKNRENDFRASGSGNFIFKEDVPSGIFDFAKKIFNEFKVPNISLDIGFDGKEFFLIEFQAIQFGSTTLQKSPFYFKQDKSDWVIHKEKSILEKEYADSVVKFINNNF
jgi:glutathione synthase/RimK-type ligase-like ATP-grasp enzyme